LTAEGGSGILLPIEEEDTAMLIELPQGEIVLEHEGRTYFPGDRLDDRRTAEEWVREMHGLPEDLVHRYLTQRRRRSWRKPKSAEPPRIVISGKVTAGAKDALKRLAREQGLTLSQLVAVVLENAATNLASAVPVQVDILDAPMAVLEEARASVTLDKDETHGTRSEFDR